MKKETQIWKYTLTGIENEIEVPLGARFLYVNEQYRKINVWAEVDPKQPKGIRILEVFGTGHPIEEAERRYLGSCKLHDGRFVFHVFERFDN